MCQILVFVAQFGKVAVVQRVLLVALGNGLDVEQSRLSQEDGLNLEEVVAVVGNSREGDVGSPLLEGLAIDAESEIACKGHEIGIFPRTVHALSPLLDGLGLLLQSLRLQGSHP